MGPWVVGTAKAKVQGLTLGRAELQRNMGGRRWNLTRRLVSTARCPGTPPGAGVMNARPPNARTQPRTGRRRFNRVSTATAPCLGTPQGAAVMNAKPPK